jgi:hypothetical protein
MGELMTLRFSARLSARSEGQIAQFNVIFGSSGRGAAW